ncbi:MAG: Maf family protein [Lachnospiraceae bacterium]|nr:Maf family protein [Lachnospiraceae bacterium]
MRRIILASGSPRRRELLSQTGLEFEVIPGEVDEDTVVAKLDAYFKAASAAGATAASTDFAASAAGAAVSSADFAAPHADPAAASDNPAASSVYPAEVVKALSLSKAEAVATQISEGIVIGSDTIVWDNGILGKPKDRADAHRMLRQLQGRVHSVFTGVTVLVKDEETLKKNTFFCETKVDVYPMTEAETQGYLDSGEPMDKAGAYGIQGKFGLWVKGIEGDYNSVVGLPLSALWQILKQYV